MKRKQTAVQYYEINHRQLLLKLENKQITIGEYAVSSFDLYNKALQMEREQMIDLVQSLKDYTHESHNILGHDEREASEFVDIYYTQTYGECTQQQ